MGVKKLRKVERAEETTDYEGRRKRVATNVVVSDIDDVHGPTSMSKKQKKCAVTGSSEVVAVPEHLIAQAASTPNVSINTTATRVRAEPHQCICANLPGKRNKECHSHILVFCFEM